MKEIIYYIIDIIVIAWRPALIMGMIAIPLMWIFNNESEEEWEKLDKYYNPSPDNEKKAAPMEFDNKFKTKAYRYFRKKNK